MTKNKQEWISIKERIPSDCGEYLIFKKPKWLDEIITIRFWNGISFYTDLQMNKEVTHWMELPSPPKDKK